MEPLLLRLKALRDAVVDMYDVNSDDIVDMLDYLIEDEEELNEVSNNV